MSKHMIIHFALNGHAVACGLDLSDGDRDVRKRRSYDARYSTCRNCAKTKKYQVYMGINKMKVER